MIRDQRPKAKGKRPVIKGQRPKTLYPSPLSTVRTLRGTDWESILVGIGVCLEQLVLHIGGNLLVRGELHRIGCGARRK